MKLRDRLKYHVYVKRVSSIKSDAPKIIERGIGSFLYHRDDRRYLRLEAQSLAQGWLGYNISITPEKSGLLIGLHLSNHFNR